MKLNLHQCPLYIYIPCVFGDAYKLVFFFEGDEDEDEELFHSAYIDAKLKNLSFITEEDDLTPKKDDSSENDSFEEELYSVNSNNIDFPIDFYNEYFSFVKKDSEFFRNKENAFEEESYSLNSEEESESE